MLMSWLLWEGTRARFRVDGDEGRSGMRCPEAAVREGGTVGLRVEEVVAGELRKGWHARGRRQSALKASSKNEKRKGHGAIPACQTLE